MMTVTFAFELQPRLRFSVENVSVNLFLFSDVEVCKNGFKNLSVCLTLGFRIKNALLPVIIYSELVRTSYCKFTVLRSKFFQMHYQLQSKLSHQDFRFWSPKSSCDKQAWDGILPYSGCYFTTSITTFQFHLV